MSILYLIASENFISVHRDLIKAFGVEAALLIGELASEFDYYSRRDKLVDGYFYSTVENIKDKTGLSEHQQRKAFKVLQENQIVEIKKMGIPAKRFVKIDEQVFLNVYHKWCKISSTGASKNEELELEKLSGNKNKSNNNIINDNKEKHIYGEFKNVFLTDEEYQKIEEKGLTYLIEELSSYMARTGKTYKSHYSTILCWSRRKPKKEESEPSFDLRKESEFLY